MYSDVVGVRITSPFATVEETAKILGVSRRRMRELARLVDGDGFKTAASRSLRNESSNKPKTRRKTRTFKG